jgi:hypothetical protein
MTRAACLALLLVPALAAAAPVPKGLKARPAGSPDGYWYLVELTLDGVTSTSWEGTARHTLIEGERYSCGVRGRPDGRDAASIPVRDPDRPHLRRWGEHPAVFEVDGDTLRACYAYDGRAELSECKPGKGIHYYVFERVKDEKK